MIPALQSFLPSSFSYIFADEWPARISRVQLARCRSQSRCPEVHRRMAALDGIASSRTKFTVLIRFNLSISDEMSKCWQCINLSLQFGVRIWRPLTDAMMGEILTPSRSFFRPLRGLVPPLHPGRRERISLLQKPEDACVTKVHHGSRFEP